MAREDCVLESVGKSRRFSLYSSKPYAKQTDTLFHSITPNQVTVAFRRVCNKAGILDFRFHDLRHTAASWLRMRGADIHTVAQLLGHKDLRMAARYEHLSPAFLAEAVSRLDEGFDAVRYQDVTTPESLELAVSLTPSEKTGDSYGI
jgi:integrase